MNIIDIFNEYFEMIPATSEELKHEVYKLRYQVYCIENGDKTGFMNPMDHPEEIEFDEYDSHSSHYLIRHRRLGIYMATTRLILPDAKNREKPFPIEKHSQIDDVALLKTMPRHNLAELSRFCVSKEFRRRKNEPHLLTTIDAESEAAFTQEEKRSSSHLTLALFACAIKMSSENNIHYWYALMEPALMRVISTLGIHFVGIGPLVDFYGMRRPCAIKVDDLLDSVATKNLTYWNMLTNNG
ncbi:MAG: PEP-CTERM/exosortase system-associated acyltransferase [Methylobacter sp.]|nr:PEP-CTERM/exosortase system-associated acyltransferase [Methylobacter sp.]